MVVTIGFVKILSFATLLFFLCAAPAQAQVVLSEVYPAPTSEEKEWVELFNTSADTVDISGWKLFEHFSSRNELTTFANIQIEPYSFVIFELPANKLNNSEEKITLENSSANEVSTIYYTNSESQKSFSFLFLSETLRGEILQLGIPTKNTINPFEPIATEQPTVPSQPTDTPLPQATISTTEPTPNPTTTATVSPVPSSYQTTTTPAPNQKLEEYRAVSSAIKLPKLVKTEKAGLQKRLPKLSYIVQKKVSKIGVFSAIIGGSVLLFIGFLL